MVNTYTCEDNIVYTGAAKKIRDVEFIRGAFNKVPDIFFSSGI